jgi:beta-phosphoglucomutase
MPMHTYSWKLYLEQHGIHAPDVVEKMHGRRNDEIVAAFWGNDLSAQENFEHGAAKEALWRELMEPVLESHLVPGIRSFLERYSEAPIGLGTNAEPANAAFVLGKAKLSPMFKAIVDGMQVAKPKPWPDVYCRASDLLGVEASNCIVFEDSPAGVKAARAAGMRVVGIRTHLNLEGVDFSCSNFLDPALDAWLATQTVRGSSP